MKKVSLPVVMVIGCILIVLGLGIAFLIRKDDFKLQDKSEETIKRTDYSRVARKTLDWIDFQRNEEGWYILERGCDYETKTCDTVWDNKEGNKDGLIATWARLNFYEQDQDPKDLEIVKKDIDIFYDKYKDDNLKDSLWICKITYEMAQSKHLDQTQKDKLRELCLNIDYGDLPELEEDLADQPLIGLSKRNTWRDWYGYKAVGRGFNVSFGRATEIINQYRWNKSDDKQRLTDTVKDYFDLIKKYVSVDGINGNNICLAGISSLDIYEFGGGDETNIEFAKEIYNSGISHEGDRKRFQTAICAYLSKELSRVTGDNQYLAGLENQNKLLMTSFRDDEGSYAWITGDFGFMKTTTGGLSLIDKNVAENGLIVEVVRD